MVKGIHREKEGAINTTQQRGRSIKHQQIRNYLLLVLTKIAAIKAHEYEIFATKEFSFSLSLLTERENNRIKFVSNNNL